MKYARHIIYFTFIGFGIVLAISILSAQEEQKNNNNNLEFCTDSDYEEIEKFLKECGKKQWKSTCIDNASLIYGCKCRSEKFPITCEKYY